MKRALESRRRGRLARHKDGDDASRRPAILEVGEGSRMCCNDERHEKKKTRTKIGCFVWKIS